MTEDFSRRPIASRNTRWAAHVTRRLVEARVSPNHISMGSVVAALLACGAFALSGCVGPVWAGLFLIAGAGLTQLRLLCNLFDGLVAVEGGMGSPDGAFWNEVPDRLSDLLILAGRPSMGKTALATNIAFNVARNYRWEPAPEGRKTVSGGVVAFYSLEMSAEQLAMRILADASGVSSDKLRKGEIDAADRGRQ